MLYVTIHRHDRDRCVVDPGHGSADHLSCFIGLRSGYSVATLVPRTNTTLLILIHYTTIM
jgi:hypothetical protein